MVASRSLADEMNAVLVHRSGKSSIQRVVFHKMSPTETLFLESTSKINKDNIQYVMTDLAIASSCPDFC